MDIQNLTLTGLAAIGAVNVVTFFRPDLDSKIKFTLSLIVAFLVTFIPADLGLIILDKIKEALLVAFAASGTYKLADKIGGE